MAANSPAAAAGIGAPDRAAHTDPAAAAGGFSNSAPDAGGLLVVLVIGLAAVLLGLALIPVRGWFLRRNFERI